MRVRIAYLPEEEQKAERLATAVSAILEDARPHRKEKHPPIRHIYFSERKAEKGATAALSDRPTGTNNT